MSELMVPAEAAHLVSADPLGASDIWTGDVRRVGDAVAQGLRDAVERASRQIEQMDDSRLSGLGFVLSPVAGTLLTLTDDDVKAQLRDRLAQAARKVSDALQEVWDWIATETAHYLGSPSQLLDLSERYHLASAQLDWLARRGDQSVSDVMRHWGGGAPLAFRDAARAQLATVGVFGGWLDRSAQLVANAADTLKQLWIGVLQAVLNLYAETLSTIGSAFDVGNAPTFEVGPVLDAAANCLAALVEVGAQVARTVAQARTSWSAQWASIMSAPEAPAGRWPRFDAGLAHDYGTTGRWFL